MTKNNIWIVKEYKKEYSDFVKTGLKLHFLDIEINEALRIHYIKFCKWLRKKYWFPIRCNARFEYYPYYKDRDDKKKNKNAIAMFYYPKINNLNQIIIYPEIRIAVSEYQRKIEAQDKYSVLYHYLGLLVHELTHYFQWYFFETDERTQRSLEIEANYWAHYLVTVYFEEHGGTE